MLNRISRCSFLRCVGCAGVLAAAGALAGCQTGRKAVEVDVGDHISNWNDLRVQLSSLFRMGDVPDMPGQEYVAVLILVQNLSRTESRAVGAPHVLEIDAEYPLPPLENLNGYFHALSADTPDFALMCDGQSAGCGAYIYLYDAQTDTFANAPELPPQRIGYIELMCRVPVGWKELNLTYMPQFLQDKSITFRMTADQLTKIVD